jgi:hypothetical protein
MQAFYTENFDFSEAGFIRINQIGIFSKHLFKKKYDDGAILEEKEKYFFHQ